MMLYKLDSVLTVHNLTNYYFMLSYGMLNSFFFCNFIWKTRGNPDGDLIKKKKMISTAQLINLLKVVIDRPGLPNVPNLEICQRNVFLSNYHGEY